MEAKDSMSIEAEEKRRPLRWIAGSVATIVTLAIVAGLVYYRVSSKGSASNPPVGSATVSGVAFSCRLPVLAGATGGFISFPDGAITIDRQVTFGNFKGGYGYSYDSQVKKWVPVPSPSLSPDGRSYAYLAQTTGVPGEMMTMSLHTHDLASGSDRVLWQGQGSPMGPNEVTWLASGIYFSAVMYSADGPQGPTFPALFVADPNHAGTPRRVGPNPPPQPPGPNQPYYSGPDQFSLVGGGAAWGTGQRVPKEVPTPDKPPTPGTFGPDRILRMDLRDGSVTTWYAVSSTDLVSLMGLDAQGRPILSLFQPKIPVKDAPAINEPPPITLLLLTGPNQTVEITSGNPDFHFGSQPSADSHGVWLGSWNSIWLYTSGTGLHQVATIPAGTFPDPTPPSGYPAKGSPVSGSRIAMPSYMQGTLFMPAGPCA
jgi:hypothetical protein